MFYGGSFSLFSGRYSNCQFVSPSSSHFTFLFFCLPTLLFPPCTCFLIVFSFPLRAECGLQEVAIASNRSSQPIELLDRFAIIDPLLQQLILTLFTQVQQDNKHQRLYLESLQNLLAAHLLQFHCTVQIRDVDISTGLSASKLQTVLDYIHDHLDSEIGLGELAAVVQLSSHHFGKLFKQSMSISPHQYVLRCRIARAKQLLASPQRSLVNIGQAIGFSDQSHFTNTFRRYTGLTPRQYRQQL